MANDGAGSNKAASSTPNKDRRDEVIEDEPVLPGDKERAKGERYDDSDTLVTGSQFGGSGKHDKKHSDDD